MFCVESLDGVFNCFWIKMHRAIPLGNTNSNMQKNHVIFRMICSNKMNKMHENVKLSQNFKIKKKSRFSLM